MSAATALTKAVLIGITNARSKRSMISPEDFVAAVMSNICATDATRIGWLIVGGRIMAVDGAEWTDGHGDMESWSVRTHKDQT